MKMSDKTDHCFISADIKKENSKSQLLKDDQVHADQDFYDNLPFNKLRNPPKHVRNTISLTNYKKGLCPCVSLSVSHDCPIIILSAVLAVTMI